MKILAFSFINFLSVAAVGCKTPRNSHAEVAHASGEAGMVAEGPYWFDGRQLFASNPQFAQDVAHGKALAADHPLSKRFNEWAALMDTNLRQAGVLSSAVPPPQVVVLQNHEDNAYVTSARLCLDLAIAPKDEPNTAPDAKTMGLVSGGVIEKYDADRENARQVACRAPTPKEFQAIAAFYAASSGELGCTVSAHDSKLLLSRDCYREIEYDENDNRTRIGEPAYWSSTHLLLDATLNLVFLMTGTIEKAGEESMVVATLAHELGHYYRSHQSPILKQPAYPYFHGDLPQKGRPSPSTIDPSSHLGQVLETIGARIDYFPRYSWQKTGTVTWHAMDAVAQWTTSNCKAAGCEPACKQLAQQLGQSHYAAVLTEIGKTQVWTRSYPATFISQYQKWENDLQACLSAIGTGAPLFQEVIFSSPWTRFSAPGAKNAWEALIAMDKRNEDLAQKFLEAAAEARAAHIGFYSIEQEADEFSTEALVYAGLDPARSIKSALSRGWDHPSPGVPDFKLCHRMAKEGWKNADGTWQILTPFDIEGDHGAHHDACYRAYNMTRELEAHPEYKDKKFSSLAPVHWHELRKSVPTEVSN